MIKPFEEVYNCDSITLDVTNNCNLRCIYCFEGYKKPENMPPEIAVDAIKKAYKEVPRETGTFTINFFGGEPLLNWPAIKAVIDYCNEAKLNVRYGITTNLVGLTDEMLTYFDDNSVYVMVSIDGIREVHNKNRSNSYDRVVSNIKRMSELGLNIFIEARMTILPEDVKYALKGVQEIFNMGIDNICPMVVTDVHWDKQHLFELEKFYVDLNNYYIALLNQEDLKRNISIKRTDEVLTNILSPDLDDPIMCPIFSDRWCTIDVHGDVYPCHQLPTSKDEIKLPQKLGNIYTGVDDELIYSNAENLIKAAYSKPECKNCYGRSICKAGCPEENLRETNNMQTPNDDYCNTVKALVNAVYKVQDSILNASNIRNRRLNLLKLNLQIKDYIVNEIIPMDLTNKLVVNARLMHVNEMIDSVGENNLFPTFSDYFKQILGVIGAAVFAANDIPLEQIEKSLEKEKQSNG